jgi:hypothetical protein
MVLIELDERCVRSVWDISHVPVKNFNWLPFTPPPPLIAFYGPSEEMLAIANKYALAKEATLDTR